VIEESIDDGATDAARESGENRLLLVAGGSVASHGFVHATIQFFATIELNSLIRSADRGDGGPCIALLLNSRHRTADVTTNTTTSSYSG